MPKPKKKPQQQTFDAQVDSLLSGLHLTSAMLPAKPKTSKSPTAKAGQAEGAAGEGQTAEPALVSKLIDFIKTI